MLSRGRQLEATILFALALLSCLLFLRNDPWSARDGVFLEYFVAALPFFLSTPTLIGMSLYVGWASTANRLLNLLSVAVFVTVPLTRAYAVHLVKVATLLWSDGHD
jgi:hypothetical protein